MTLFRNIISALYLPLISRVQRRLCQLADGMLNHLSVAVHGQEALITDQLFESWKQFLACNGSCSPGGQASDPQSTGPEFLLGGLYLHIIFLIERSFCVKCGVRHHSQHCSSATVRAFIVAFQPWLHFRLLATCSTLQGSWLEKKL